MYVPGRELAVAFLDVVLANVVDRVSDRLQGSYAWSGDDAGAMWVTLMLGYASVGSDFVQPSVSLQLASLDWCGFDW